MQVAEEVFLLSRTVRTFGTEESEKKRYQSRLGILRHISIRQAGAYLLYLTSNSFLFNLTKVGKHISQNVPLLSISSFQSRNVYFDSETSSLHWKSELRNVWGQQTRVSTLWRCYRHSNVPCIGLWPMVIALGCHLRRLLF